MSASLAHKGLPSGVTPHKLFALIRRIARGANKQTRISTGALRVLEHHIFACRSSDFEKGRICGTWEQAETVAAALGISTRVFHNAEAELVKHGFIERTYNAHARRKGKRHGDRITSLAGISLRPLIDGFKKWQNRLEAIELQARAVAQVKDEIGACNRLIRLSGSSDLIEQAGLILPAGRISRIGHMERLKAIKADLEALLVFVEVPSGTRESSVQSEDISAPNILPSSFVEDCSTPASTEGSRRDEIEVSPLLVAGLASDDYRTALQAKGRPSWRSLIEASSIACSWLGISQRDWGEACSALGRERAAVCVMVIDRNRRLPEDHRYHRKHALGSLRGMASRGTADVNLTGLLMAIQGYPEGACGSEAPLPPTGVDRRAKGAHFVGDLVPRFMAGIQICEEEDLAW